MENLMSLQRYVHQLRPIQENKTDYVEQVQNLFLNEELQFPKDIFDGFEFTQTQKSDRAAAQIRVSSADRDTDREITFNTRVALIV